MTSTAETSPHLAARPSPGRPGLARGRARLDQGDAAPPDDRALAAALHATMLHLAGSGAGEPAPAVTDAASVLWLRFRKFDAADPAWPDRDRFVLSPGLGIPLRRALRHLTGHPAGPADGAARGRSAGSAAADGLGEGLGDAVGMALAERLLTARFGRSLVDHRTWALAGDGDMMQGAGHEAASLAGLLRLERLTVLWDDAAAEQPDAEDTLRRFAAYGWATKRVAAHDHAALAGAFGMAMRSRKPTLIACRAAPRPASTGRRSPMLLSEPVLAGWRAAGQRGAAARRAWLKRLTHHPRRAEFERVAAGRLPESLAGTLGGLASRFAAAGEALATGAASQHVLAALAGVLPELAGGSAEPAEPGAGGRFVHFGLRAHAMAAALNGMAAHGGLLPFGATAGRLSDAVRPALRAAAAARSRIVHVLGHDARPGCRDAPPLLAERLASLRAVPNLQVLRPADAIETAECWELALRCADGPSLLVLGPEAAPVLRPPGGGNRCAQGGYLVAEADGPRQATLIATGPEVTLALAARARLAGQRIAVAVVSLPCWELFARAGAAYHARVLGDALRVGIEAGSGFGWERWLGPEGVFIGCEDAAGLAQLTPEAIAATVRRRLAA